jgi:hypothetical protein
MAPAEPSVKTIFRKLFESFQRLSHGSSIARRLWRPMVTGSPVRQCPPSSSISKSRRAARERQRRSCRKPFDLGSHQSADPQVAHGAAAIWKGRARPSMALLPNFKQAANSLRAD